MSVCERDDARGLVSSDTSSAGRASGDSASLDASAAGIATVSDGGDVGSGCASEVSADVFGAADGRRREGRMVGDERGDVERGASGDGGDGGESSTSWGLCGFTVLGASESGGCRKGVLGSSCKSSPASAPSTSRRKKLSVKLISSESPPSVVSAGGRASLSSVRLLTDAVKRLSSPSSYERIPKRTLLPVPGVCGERRMPRCLGRGVYKPPASMVERGEHVAHLLMTTYARCTSRYRSLSVWHDSYFQCL